MNQTQAELRLVASCAVLLAMRRRLFWLDALDAACRRRTVVWLSGVRRRNDVISSLADFFDNLQVNPAPCRPPVFA